jgi:hypothetical protein
MCHFQLSCGYHMVMALCGQVVKWPCTTFHPIFIFGEDPSFLHNSEIWMKSDTEMTEENLQ